MSMTGTMDRIGQDMKETGRSLWLAGLGAASSVESNGRELFDSLVARGEARKAKGFTPSPAIKETGEKVAASVKEFGRKVENRVEGGVTSTMKRFNVPVREDFEDLITRIDHLSRKVDALAKK